MKNIVLKTIVEIDGRSFLIRSQDFSQSVAEIESYTGYMQDRDIINFVKDNPEDGK